MGNPKKRCFVVMGFGTKTDYVNGRKLDLNKSYKYLIKPVVESKGIECVRADEILHSGSIDVQMYKELLTADLVIADLSTSNSNAIYELGIRHALRPYTTIVVSEDKLVYPFDLNHIVISQYNHLGEAIDIEEAERFKERLGQQIEAVINKGESDSPVYTYLNSLIPPKIQDVLEAAVEKEAETHKAAPDTGEVLSKIIQDAEDFVEQKEFEKAKQLFQTAVILAKMNSAQPDTYLIHRLAFTTYKSAKPDLVSALYESMKLLQSINLAHTNDPETVSMAGAIEKKLFECGQGDQHLEEALLYFLRSYYTLNNRYNGINLALAYVYRSNSSLSTTHHDKVADLVIAKRTWERVLFLCERDYPVILEKEKKDQARLADGTTDGKELKEYYDAQKFWISANRAEAYFGLGRFEEYNNYLELAKNNPHPLWMWESFTGQMGKLAVELTKAGHLMEPIWKAPV
ncbi:tetratricopeptide repeat-containing protein [Algoriphagus sp.]|uniref:tetratricopeptide repeat-containing protein n=1 Tax=Algoriphagus sp. TaxID=1872435 RepID=UPI003280E88D